MVKGGNYYRRRDEIFFLAIFVAKFVFEIIFLYNVSLLR